MYLTVGTGDVNKLIGEKSAIDKNYHVETKHRCFVDLFVILFFLLHSVNKVQHILGR